MLTVVKDEAAKTRQEPATVLERVFLIFGAMTSNTDKEAAADLAAAEQELADMAAPTTPDVTEPVAQAAPVVAEVLPEDAPRRGLRAQAVELVGQVNALSAQVEAQRMELEALRAAAPLVIPAPVTPIAPATDAEVELTVGAPVPDATLTVASQMATTPVAEADGAAAAVAPSKATPVSVAPVTPVTPVAAVVADASPIQTASETAALTFDGLMEGMDEPHRDVVEKHIIGLRSALEKEREDRKGAQKAVRTAQAEIESIPTLRQQLELAEQDALDTHAQATFFEHAGSNDVKRGSARLAFLAAKDGQYFDDDGSVQWESLKARFPDLFEGTDRSAPTGVIVGTPELKDAVVSVRPAAAPRASASAGNGGGAPPRRPFSMTSAIRSAAGRSVK